MYVAVQTVCGCHGLLLFESIHCDRCRSIIPYQITDESLIDPVVANTIVNGVDMKAIQSGKHTSNMLVPYRKPHHHHHHHHHHHYQQQEISATTGRIRFRTFCPFCNSPTYVLRYYCKRERLYYHLRVQTFGESEQSVYKSIADTQQMNNPEKFITPRSAPTETSTTDTMEDSYSLTGSISYNPPSTILYDQSRVPNARDMQIENEKKLYQLNDLEGDLFNVLRNGLFYDTVIQCRDEVKIQVHRCILGGRSPWFRHLLSQHHDSNTQDDYVLQISIDDVTSEVMNEILNFMYTNRCLISLKNAPDLLVASKRFELDRLTKQVADFLLSRLTIDNAIEMFVSAHESGSEALKLACIRLINRNAEKIKRTDKWRTFKAQYVDLVPELYENRIERPEPAQAGFLPDVFVAPTEPSDSLIALSKLYENPVKQRLPSPSARILPRPTKYNQPQTQRPSSYQEHQRPELQQPITQGTSGHFVQRHDSVHSIGDNNRKSPVKKRAASMTRQRPVLPLTRNVFPSMKQNTEIDAYRRPVNVFEKSLALPAPTQKQPSFHTQLVQKPQPSITKISRAVSPRRVIEIRRSPSMTDLQPDEQMTLGRVVSVETMD